MQMQLGMETDELLLSYYEASAGDSCHLARHQGRYLFKLQKSQQAMVCQHSYENPDAHFAEAGLRSPRLLSRGQLCCFCSLV